MDYDEDDDDDDADNDGSDEAVHLCRVFVAITQIGVGGHRYDAIRYARNERTILYALALSLKFDLLCRYPSYSLFEIILSNDFQLYHIKCTKLAPLSKHCTANDYVPLSASNRTTHTF